MIDYLTVIYRNYDLLELQVENFKKRFDKKHYNLIVVDNTPDLEKKVLTITEDYKYIYCHSTPTTFGGFSHGRAIDYGLKFCTTKIVSIIDSDFFILNNNMHHYIVDKFEKGYKAIGAELNRKCLTEKNPENFKNIPCCFCSYYDINLAKSKSWIVTQKERRLANFCLEVGWKIRKYILDNQIKTLTWKSKDDYDNNDCYFENEIGDLMGMHYVGGSGSVGSRSWNKQSKQDLKSKIMIKHLL